ncbi:MAG: DUF3179 domain-containing protein [Nitrospinae bacterium]|nr:DUF3179 domain-containing protein [Nitrospinota bacterium]MBL7020912.1 DUF3179 domain-containing protein [Nitrospinaceae bacterium]
MLKRREHYCLKALCGIFIIVMLCGFDTSRHSIPIDDIYDGGPGKDGIPAILKPKFISVEEADKTLLKKNDRILGYVYNGQAKAYPIKILNWHEIVNDRVGGASRVVTYCPLCGTGMVFDTQGRNLTFGVSGLLYQSDMLLYDHQTESLWSQIKSEAVTGNLTGARLKLLPSTHTNWASWKAMHPETRVLSDNTGYRRDYDRDPYQGYETSERLMFGVSAKSRKYPPKEKVIGVKLGEVTKAYPFSELNKVDSPVKDVLDKRPIQIFYDRKSRTAVIRDENNREIPSVVGFWFAWVVFHPETRVFSPR